MNTTVLGDLAGQTLGGRYLVGRQVARGGMATVYLATDTRLQRPVAVKVLRPDLSADEDFLERFLREARATAALSHPNVVAVFDFDVTESIAYLVLEYVPGHTLRHVLAEHRLTPSQSLATLDPVLDALVAAHEVGIVHRDIKPENVLIGPKGLIKVADFGLARAMDDQHHQTRTGLVIGTAAYVSPEHVAGTGTGAASDIYSSGILLYEMLTGHPPFAGENALSVAYQHVNSEVPRPSSGVADIPSELDDLVLGATAREPADRFPTAEAFLEELRRVRALMPAPEPLPPLAATLVIADEGRAAVVPVDSADDLVPVDDDGATVGLLPAPDGPPQDLVPAPPGRRPRRRLTAVMLGLLGVAIVAGLAWAFVSGPLQRATVPDLVGLSKADAEAALAGSEMRLEVDEQQYSETAPKDTIISQDPAAESGGFIRFPVSVVLSLGQERYAVPDVRGMSVGEATDALAEVKLEVAGQQPAFDETVPKGDVAGADPAIDAILKPGTGVTLLVSDGPAPRPVPDVLGQSAEDATSTLAASGLGAATTEAYSDDFRAGTVAAAAPGVGTEVAKGTEVTLTISKGPPPVEVPRVVDMKRDDAIARLQGAGFKVRLQEGIVTPLDRVYSQDPPPGETLPRGSTVTISIF